MRFLLDGYNLANWLARDPDLQPAQLRAMLRHAIRTRNVPVASSMEVYWDVRSRDPSIPANEYFDEFTAHNVPDADAAIIDAVRDAAKPSQCTVVSRDREVTGKSRQLGARIMSPKDFFGAS